MAYTPRYENLITILDDCLAQYDGRPLFGTREASGWTYVSYSEFGELVAKARAGLASHGIGPGDRVAVISNNRLEWAVCAYATYTLGAAYVPMYESQLDKDWEFILRDSGSKVCLVANATIEQRVRGLQGDLPELLQIVCFDGESYRDMLAAGAERPVGPAPVENEDIAMFIYTSGTTGNPKGVKLTHRNLATNVSSLLEVSPVQGGDRSLAFLPWAHVFGGSVELNTVMAVGGTIAICDDTDKLLGYLPEVKPTMLFAVPRIWNRIYDGVQKQVAGRPKIVQTIFHSGLAAKSKLKRGEALTLGEKIALPLAEALVFSKIIERFGGELRFAFSGAAALSGDVAEFIDNLGIKVYEGYGMTESSGCTTANTEQACRIGSVGKPVPGADVKLDHHAPGAGEGEGEIIIYGSGVMQGYHNLEDATREALTEDGGLRSGDLGRFDEDGFLYITGRVKELYKLENGKYVAPAPIEESLQLSPFILQCVVHGADHPHNVALVVPDLAALDAWAEREGLPRDPDQLLAHPKTRELLRREIETYSRELKGYEAVRDFLILRDEFTTQNDMLTPTLKLKRKNVMARYGSDLDALYT